MDDFHAQHPLMPKGKRPRAPESLSTTGALPRYGPWRRLARKVREVGIRYTAILVARALIPMSIFGFTRMVILEILTQGMTHPIDADEKVRWAGPMDIHDLEALGHRPEALEGRFAAGARSCILADDHTILAYVWFHGPYHDEEDLSVRFTLSGGELWLFDAMVRTDQRGRGIYPRLLRQAVRQLAREGVRRILISIESANRNSIRAHRIAGAEVIGTISSLRILGFTFIHHSRHIRVAWTGRAGYVRLPSSDIS
jgi:GNAT superfamily N-acetyltransferase